MTPRCLACQCIESATRWTSSGRDSAACAAARGAVSSRGDGIPILSSKRTGSESRAHSRCQREPARRSSYPFRCRPRRTFPMHPWVERPTVTIDLARVRRGEPPDLPPDAVAASRALLGEVMASIPPKARLLAYLLAIRTGNRFGREFKAAAKLIHGDPRDIALANLSYDLVVCALGCSTIVLTTPDGP